MLKKIVLVLVLVTFSVGPLARAEQGEDEWRKDRRRTSGSLCDGPFAHIGIAAATLGVIGLVAGLSGKPEPEKPSAPSPIVLRAAERTELMDKVTNKFSNMDPKERAKQLETWHEESPSQLAFMERVAKEMGLSPDLQLQLVRTTKKWLTDTGTPEDFKFRKAGGAYKIFSGVAHWVTTDQALANDIKDGGEMKKMAMILTVADLFNSKDTEAETDELKAQMKKGFLDKTFDAAKMKAAKELIELNVKRQIRTDKTIQKVF